MKTIVAVAILIGGFLSTGCAGPTPVFDEHFGDTVATLRAQQTSDPEAPIRNQSRSVEGMDGRSARESLDRYYKTFREPPPPPPALLIAPGTGAR